MQPHVGAHSHSCMHTGVCLHDGGAEGSSTKQLYPDLLCLKWRGMSKPVGVTLGEGASHMQAIAACLCELVLYLSIT